MLDALCVCHFLSQSCEAFRRASWRPWSDGVQQICPQSLRLSPSQNFTRTSSKSFPIYGQNAQCFLRKKHTLISKPCFGLALTTATLRSTEISVKFHVELACFKFAKKEKSAIFLATAPDRVFRKPVKRVTHRKTKCLKTNCQLRNLFADKYTGNSKDKTSKKAILLHSAACLVNYVQLRPCIFLS